MFKNLIATINHWLLMLDYRLKRHQYLKGYNAAMDLWLHDKRHRIPTHPNTYWDQGWDEGTATALMVKPYLTDEK